jgi:hypothetical protein
MEILLKKANIKDAQIKRLTVKIVSTNLSALSEACYKPDLKKHYYEFLKLSNLTEKDVREFTKRRWKGRKEAKFAIVSEPIANFYVFLMQYFLSKKDTKTYQYLMALYIIRHYANKARGFWPNYCKPEVFKYALDVLTKTHLFSREKTISNALFYISKEMIKRWTDGILNNNLDEISLFMITSRHRVAQSLRSFANTYYRVDEEGSALKTEDDYEDSGSDDGESAYQQQTVDKSIALIDNITKKITVYRHFDKNALEDAKKVTKINVSLANRIVSKINNTKYSDNLRLIYKLYLKDIKSTNQLCGKDFYAYVRQLMQIKRTTSKIYFKQQINILLLSLLKDFNYSKEYSKLTNQTKFLINLFLAYYLSMVFRNSLCKR